MGKLLLAHIQSAVLAPSPEQALPIKNTFIHFRRQQPLKRTSTDPAGGAAYDDNLESALNDAYPAAIVAYPDNVESTLNDAYPLSMQTDGYGLAPTVDEESSIPGTVV
jgi:hypothetical protein